MQKIREQNHLNYKTMDKPIQICIDFRKKILKKRRNELLRQKRCDIVEIDQFWDIDYWIGKDFDKNTLNSFQSTQESVQHTSDISSPQ